MAVKTKWAIIGTGYIANQFVSGMRAVEDAILEAVATAIFAKNAASYIQSVSVGLAKLTVSFEVAVVAYVLALVIAIISGFLNRRKMEA